MSVVTRDLSFRDDSLRPFPATCPKCGAAIGRSPRRDVPVHFRRHHEISIGLAFSRDDNNVEAFSFVYISPVSGVTRRQWYVVLPDDWPFGIVKISPDEWRIAWIAGNGPGTEGVIG